MPPRASGCAGAENSRVAGEVIWAELGSERIFGIAAPSPRVKALEQEMP